MNDITQLYENFKSDVEKSEFITAQQSTIAVLKETNAKLEAEVKHLQELVGNAVPITTKITLSPEETVIEDQIRILQMRSRDEGELELNDVKKLDILLRCKKLIHEETTIETTSKPVKHDIQSLLALVDPNGKS